MHQNRPLRQEEMYRRRHCSSTVVIPLQDTHTVAKSVTFQSSTYSIKLTHWKGKCLSPLKFSPLLPIFTVMNSFTLVRSLRAVPSRHYTIRPLLTVQPSRTLLFDPRIRSSLEASSRHLTTENANKMSFSNTDTGDKPADPYKEQNKNETSLKEKVQDLVAFMEKCKFAMMTTRIGSSGLLVSRCMALAAKVWPRCLTPSFESAHSSSFDAGYFNTDLISRKVAVSISSSTPIPSQAKRMT